MTNDEITEYMNAWVANIRRSGAWQNQALAAALGIPVLLAEIAKRLPAANDKEKEPPA